MRAVRKLSMDKASHPFIPSLVSIKILKHVVVREIPKYNGVGDPFRHMNKHEYSLQNWTINVILGGFIHEMNEAKPERFTSSDSPCRYT